MPRSGIGLNELLGATDDTKLLALDMMHDIRGGVIETVG